MNKKKLSLCLGLLTSVAVQAEQVTFTNGDSLNVDLIKQTPKTLTISHPTLGEQTIEKVNITNLDSLNLVSVKGDQVHQGVFGLGVLQGWDSSFDLGVTGSDGPTENFNFRVGLISRYVDDDHRWLFSSYYTTSSTDGETIANKANATLLKDWFFTDSNWFAFAGLTYDFDKFKDWDHRLQVMAGPGYQFVNNEVWSLSGRAAAVGVFEFGVNDGKYISESSISETDEVTGVTTTTTTPETMGGKVSLGHAEIMLGADFLWNISESQVFSVSNYIYSRVTAGGKIRNVTDVAWKHDLDFFKGLAIKFNIHNEYDHSQTVKRNRNDLQYGVSLGLGF